MMLKLDFCPLEGCSSAGKKIYRQSITVFFFLKKVIKMDSYKGELQVR